MEHPQYSNHFSSLQRLYINTKIKSNKEWIKSFRLGQSATISNLAFRIELTRKLTDNRVLRMEHPQYSNRSIFPNIANITEIFM